MKFKVPQEELSKALSSCDKSLATKPSLPVLSNFLITASKNKVEFLATDLETATKVDIFCKIDIEGATTLPGKTLVEFISQLGAEDLMFEKLGEEVLITSSENSARLSTIAAEDFPAIPQIQQGIEFVVEAKSLLSGIKRVEFCAAGDESRPVLSGVLFEVEKKTLSLVATDGYRLGYSKLEVLGGSEKIRAVIPAKALSEIAKIISENLSEGKEEKITIKLSDNLTQVNFKFTNIEFTSRLIEGEFPNWQKIIPSEFPTKIKVSKTNLVKQVRIASIFARDAGNIIRFKIEGKTMNIISNASQIGSNEARVDAIDAEGGGGEIAFNYRYVLEVLSVVEDENVNFEMIESLNPGRITAEKNDNFFHIVMPVRLQG